MSGLSAAKKRQALETLNAGRLRELLEELGLESPDRRNAEVMRGVLSDGRKLDFAVLLGALKRDELKAICEALSLDVSGKSKEDLVRRIVNGGEPESPAPAKTRESAPTNGKPEKRAGRGSAPPGPEAIPLEDATGKLTRAGLEAKLWGAADILRGSIDSSDYKNYIFGLLFLKRLSDRFEEECEALVASGQDPEDRDEHQFFVPKAARWSELKKKATNIGEALNKAMASLENANTATLEGVLAGIDYNDERRLGDSKQRDKILSDLLIHFSLLNLRNDHLSEPDMLGRAYEYLIEKFADDAGKKGGEFYTPNMVVKLIVELLAPEEGMRICDPTCGSGGMLVQTAKYVQAHSGKKGSSVNISLFGQEKNLGTWAICKMNMLLHGFPDARIEKGDTIRDPKLVQDGELMLFDRVIANPPFSLDNWGHDTAAADGYGRFHFGLPPKTKGDLAFVQHMVATLNAKGKLGVVMPHGVLFRGGGEGEIRQKLLERDLIEAVIGLPSGLFYGTGIPAAVLVMNRNKPEARRGKVLFVEASREFREGSNQNHLRDEDVRKIAKAVHAFKDIERYARAVDIAEIQKNEGNLNISRYVETAEAEEKVDIAGAIAKLRAAEQARDEAKATMDKFLEELGYGS